MKWNDVFCNTFKALSHHPSSFFHHTSSFMLPSMPMVEACRADDFDFFHPFIAAGKLTVKQMRHACDRYHLGKTKSGQPIFWMIDDMCQPLDAHIGTTWISSLLKAREPLLASWQVTHCLFGLHLMMEDGRWKKEDVRLTPVCISIVEREEAAVVLSELFPESLWLAYATTPHLTPDLFAPLEGQSVTIYPRTDPTMSTFLFFEDLAAQTRPLYNLDLRIDNTLEDHATPDQKERCIDILDFLKEPLSAPYSASIPLE